MDLTLRDALSVLSKASPFSVKTITGKPRDDLDDAKEWLYVEQDIEREFRNILSTLNSGAVVFLCGSSGDGKSEILARCQTKFQKQIRFHLDATHSFSPHQSAIEALDQLFDNNALDSLPLVVGINIGMLANYGKEGASRHSEVIDEIEKFLNGEQAGANFYFFDFENYPKFQFTSDQNPTHSRFAKQLLQRLTAPIAENPFYLLSIEDRKKNQDLPLLVNFKLLGMDAVQDAIITNLFKARLIKDQFITARALLDFIHHLLLGDQFLPDNLYGGSDNELVHRLADFDPAILHTRELDQFVLRYDLKLPNLVLSEFIDFLKQSGLICEPNFPNSYSAATFVRLFYLLQNIPIGNNFHHQFKNDFRETLLTDYSKVWLLHSNYDGSNLMKTELRQFYNVELINAIYRYANRNAPWLEKGEVFLGNFGTLQLAAPVEMKVDYANILNHSSKTVSSFLACLKISDLVLPPVAINLNLFELICKLNAVVLLDEVIEQIRVIAKQSSILRFYENGRCFTAKQDEEIIEISGMS